LNNTYVLPDIHGCHKTLKYTIENRLKLCRNDELYFLGDFINKGPDSKGVLDLVMSLIQNDIKVYSVRGNHEQLLLDAFNNNEKNELFKDRGGKETLESFQVGNIRDIPNVYIDFINELPYFIELKDYVIVHAGFDFSLDNPFSDYESMLTIRNFTMSPASLNYRKVIHGHNAINLQEIYRSIIEPDSYQLNIDNGCVYKDKEGMGNLFVLNLNDHSFHIQKNIEFV